MAAASNQPLHAVYSLPTSWTCLLSTVQGSYCRSLCIKMPLCRTFRQRFHYMLLMPPDSSSPIDRRLAAIYLLPTDKNYRSYRPYKPLQNSSSILRLIHPKPRLRSCLHLSICLLLPPRAPPSPPRSPPTGLQRSLPVKDHLFSSRLGP